MDGSNKNARANLSLAVLMFGALGLAASPTALAKERGGPGRPGDQKASSDTSTFVPRTFDLRRFVSWSD
jgi:hypothetical protein